MATRAYSTLFACLHDEATPTGSLGRGTHYSVLRAVTWVDQFLRPLDKPKVHDFGLIWDEDHDERVIPVIEGLYMEGILAPILFIGERKGGLTMVVDHALTEETSVEFEDFKVRVEDICSRLTTADPWAANVAVLDSSKVHSGNDADLRLLINDDEQRIRNYLLGIISLWELGVRPLTASQAAAERERYCSTASD